MSERKKPWEPSFGGSRNHSLEANACYFNAVESSRRVCGDSSWDGPEQSLSRPKNQLGCLCPDEGFHEIARALPR
jgi:hypothetical protein